MPNDYYDFNPSAATWALMLTGIVVFVVALSVLLIWGIGRAEAVSSRRPKPVRRTEDVPVAAPVTPAAPA